MKTVAWFALVLLGIALALAPLAISMAPVTVNHYQYSFRQILPGLALTIIAIVIFTIVSKVWQGCWKVSSPLLVLLLCPVVAWAITETLQVQQMGDNIDYYDSAVFLTKNGWNGVMSLGAWRPPGMPFFLAPFVNLGLSPSLAVVLANTVLILSWLPH